MFTNSIVFGALIKFYGLNFSKPLIALSVCILLIILVGFYYWLRKRKVVSGAGATTPTTGRFGFLFKGQTLVVFGACILIGCVFWYFGSNIRSVFGFGSLETKKVKLKKIPAEASSNTNCMYALGGQRVVVTTGCQSNGEVEIPKKADLEIMLGSPTGGDNKERMYVWQPTNSGGDKSIPMELVPGRYTPYFEHDIVLVEWAQAKIGDKESDTILVTDDNGNQVKLVFQFEVEISAIKNNVLVSGKNSEELKTTFESLLFKITGLRSTFIQSLGKTPQPGDYASQFESYLKANLTDDQTTPYSFRVIFAVVK